MGSWFLNTTFLARGGRLALVFGFIWGLFVSNPTSILGDDKVWLVGTSSWFTGTNWGPSFGVPGSSATVQINNGGTANANTTTNAVNAYRIEVGKDGTTGTMNVGGTNRNVTLVSDFDIGQVDITFVPAGGTATSNGTVTISNASNVRVGNGDAGMGHPAVGDIDVGSAGSAANVTTSGTGTLTVNSTTLLDVNGDLDVGQATADANGTATSNGTLMLGTGGSVGTVDISGDFDIGQSGGVGRATAIGNATVSAVPTMQVGLSLVLGRTTGSASPGNSGRGTVSITDTNINVGFANFALPGDINVGDAIVAGTQRATAFGSLTMTRDYVNVKRRINLGELRGGSTNTQTTTDSTLSLVNTRIMAESLDIATVLDNTKGTAKGKLSLNASLVDLSGDMTLGAGSELVFMLAGTTRSVGGTATGQYGAINAASAVFDGKLTVQLTGGFVPASGNQFQLISTTTTTGAFDLPYTLPTLTGGRTWNVAVNNSGLLLTVVPPSLPGDFNLNGAVNAADYVMWRKTNGSNMSFYNTWRINFGRSNLGSGGGDAPVPEPSTVVLAGFLFWMKIPTRRFRRSGL